MTRRFPLHVHISTLFLVLILLVGGVIGGLGLKISRDILESTANQLDARIDAETLARLHLHALAWAYKLTASEPGGA